MNAIAGVKVKQDAILPLVEDGTITLVAATTENPSYEVNRALLSRCRVYRLHSLNDYALEEILQRTEICLASHCLCSWMHELCCVIWPTVMAVTYLI